MEPLALAAMVSVDRADPAPLFEQLYRGLRDAIRAGRLAPGTRLPSSRAAAAALHLSRNTAVAAYDLLRAEGAIEARQGAAPRVLDVAPSSAPRPVEARAISLGPRGAAISQPARANLYAAPSGLFMPGAPDERLFPRAAWARALRKAALRPHGPASGYADYAGISLPSRGTGDPPRGRSRSRRVGRPDPRRLERSAAFTLLAQVWRTGRPRIRRVAGLCGGTGGLCGGRARGRGCLSTMPAPISDASRASHASPMSRRRTSIPGRADGAPSARGAGDWARRCCAWIIEDDYDGEFHWRGRAVATLQSIAPDVTLYVGSAAKSLMPALRLGWIAAPEPLVVPLREGVRNLGLGANLHAQAAFEAFVEDGAWRAHIRRIATAYEGRGRLLADSLEDRFAEQIKVSHPDGGLQLVARLADQALERRAMEMLGQAGFAVAALSRYGCGEPGPPGLVIGFADAEPARVTRFSEALAAAIL